MWFREAEMFCAACSQQMNPDARFCCNCGRPLQAAQQQPWNPYAGRIVRPRYGRMIAGVCAGIAQHYGWDPVVVRLAAVALLFCGCGSPVLLYFLAWIIMPNEPYFYVPPTYTPPPPSSAPPSGYAGSTGSAPIS
jgi:phage shock protein C